MAKPNYAFEKRQRELAKKKKKEERRRRKLEASEAKTSDDQLPPTDPDNPSPSTDQV